MKRAQRSGNKLFLNVSKLHFPSNENENPLLNIKRNVAYNKYYPKKMFE